MVLGAKPSLGPLIRAITALTIADGPDGPDSWHRAPAHRVTELIRDALQDDSGTPAAPPLHPSIHTMGVASLPGNSDDPGLLDQLGGFFRILMPRAESAS